MERCDEERQLIISLYQIRAPHFTAGLEAINGIVTKVAPILMYMKGWTPEKVLSYCRSKKWICDWVR